MVERADVERAAEVIRGRLHRTPLLSSHTLGPEAYLKAELLQKTGSFKPRGVLTKLASLTPEEKARGVIAISAGNHAQAVAWAAAQEGIDALLVMWRGASEAKVAATRGYGAAVDLEAAAPREAFERLDVLLAETGRTLVHPFDDPLTIAGQGTVGLEILEDLPDVETIVVPVGGGGLISGVAVAAAGRARVIGVEPELSTALHSALAAGERVEVTPTLDRRRPERASTPDGSRSRSRRSTSRRSCSSPRRRSRRASGSSTSGRSSRASRPARRPWLPCWRARSRAAGPSCIVSGGNVAAADGRWYPGQPMKADIHPDYVLAHVTCSCGNEFWTRSTKAELHVELCAECHPFYTGKQKLVDTGGRVERFQRRLEKAGARRGEDD